MPVRWSRPLIAAAAVLALVATGAGISSRASAQEVQNSYDVIRVQSEEGVAIPYVVWVDWTPTIVATPDGGAWAFFSAQPFNTEGAGARGRLFAARYSPETHTWGAATAMAGGEIQFGATAVVDGEGTVHLVYSDRASVEDTDFSTLYYTRTNADGAWEEPVAVAPSDTAGHQLSPNLALDDNGGLHLVWQDQRSVPEELRVPQEGDANRANAAYADIFASDYVDGAWTEPVQVSVRGENNEINASRPQFARDGDRLVAIWSVYEGVSQQQLSGAIRIEWSTRPVGENAWAEPKVFLEPNGTQIGGRLVQIAPVNGGGVLALVGRRTPDDTETADTNEATNELFMRRLDSGAEEWGEEVPLSTGEKGAFPAVAVAGDGTLYAVYENGSGPQVDVGGFAVAPDATAPGPDSVVSPAEAGAQGRPSITVDGNGAVWVVYFHQPEGGSPIETRVLRGATIPSS
jgi:hypothetical protein